MTESVKNSENYVQNMQKLNDFLCSIMIKPLLLATMLCWLLFSAGVGGGGEGRGDSPAKMMILPYSFGYVLLSLIGTKQQLRKADKLKITYPGIDIKQNSQVSYLSYIFDEMYQSQQISSRNCTVFARRLLEDILKTS